MNRIAESARFDPYYNLALEEALLERPDAGATLFLWQNEHTVVIGRNQNAWSECRVPLLESEGGRLARRCSGGGAVYHDRGNLNFSFLVPRAQYDVERQLSVLARAAAAFGLRAEVSGRNDVLLAATGEKFSGNAFHLGKTRCLHHGTVLIRADMDRLARYLAPSPEKLAARGVQSVRARVTNLMAHAPQMSVEAFKAAMRDAFIAVYGPAQELDIDEADAARVEALRSRNASRAWIYGNTPPFDLRMEGRFAWGGAELLLCVRQGRIDRAALFTDAMDDTLSTRVEAALTGGIGPEEAPERLLALAGAEARDLAGLVKRYIFC